MPDNSDFYQRIGVALDTDGDVVINGPGTAKLEFKAYLDQHRPHIAARVEAATPGRTT
jgi:stalled ribosome rescue protein Dom34